MVKRILQLSLILIIMGLLAVALPVLAVSVTNALYRADIVIANTGTAATNVAVVCPINTQALIDGKYVTTNLLNTATQFSGGDIPYMPGVNTNPWVFWVPSIQDNETKPYIFYAGGPAMQTGFNYFPASGGMTTSDNDTSLELGNNFTIEQKGYVDTSYVADKNLVYKQGAFRTCVSSTGNITSEVFAISSISPYSSTSDGRIYTSNAVYDTAWTAASGTVDSSNTGIGQFISGGTYSIFRSFFYFDTSPIPDDATITNGTLKLYGNTDVSDTDFLMTIQNGQPTYPTDPMAATDYNKVYYSGDGGSLTTVGFTTTGYNNIPLNAAGLTWISKTGTTKLCVRSSREIAGTAPTGNEIVAVEVAEGAHDPQLVVNYYETAAATVTVTGVTSGVRKIVTSDNTTAVTLSVYDASDALIGTNSVAFSDNVSNNSNNWSFLTNGSMPYMEYQKIWIGGTAPANLKQHIVYERNTVFNDLTEYNNDATPTFVTTSSDPDVSATLQNFKPIKEAICTFGSSEEVPEMLITPPIQPPEFFGGEESGILNIPGAAVINTLLDFADIPLDFFWIMFIYGLAVGAVLLSYHFIRSSLLWPTVIGGVVILFFSLVTGGNPISLWTLFIYGIIATGVLVSERVFGW